MKEKIVSAKQAVDFSIELRDRATQYSATLNPAHPLWKDLGPEAEGIIASLNIIKVERYRPALLTILANFPAPELIRAMRFILNGSVRYLVAVGAGGGTLEAAWSDAARKVTTKEIKDAAGFAKEMQKIVPNDEVFRAGFQSARSSRSYLARYFLGSLERHARGEKDCELVPNTDVTAVNLEHVLPDNPSDNWKGIHPEVAAAYARRIGNQALMNSKKNSSIGNQPFEVKRKILAESEFVLTKQIGQKPSWGPTEIEERQTGLADMAVKVWAYKV